MEKMNMRRVIIILGFMVALGILPFTGAMRADQYNTFRATRYYSTSREYFVQVTPKRRATLYRSGRRPRRMWTRTLVALPGRLLVTNDGSRVAIIDRYYGNASDPDMPVVTLLDQTGEQIAKYLLSEVANLSRVIKTTSQAQWYRNAKLTQDERFLVIDTVIAKRDPATCGSVSSPEEAEECSRSVPYEQLRFSTASGKLTSRIRMVASATASSH